MIRSEKKLKELDLLLHNKNTTIVAEGIESLRREQPYEGAIGLLTSYYDNNNDPAVRKIIGEFMNDLKDQSISYEIINEIKKPWKSETIRMLISSCWQSGLDYSPFSADIARIFVRGDYMTVVECFTVIEESVSRINRDIKNEIINIVQEETTSTGDEKTPLLIELLSLLK